MYYEYWGMQKAPFDNVPDTTLYWHENKSMEDAIAEILFAIEEGNDCLAVLTGGVGTGKTMSLRVILNELDAQKYRLAFITNPDLSSIQLLREIIGQLQNKKIISRYKDQLMEEFNTILFDCANKGQKVVIFIDEANVMSSSQLHNLRLMTNFQDDQQNMLIFVLAGQTELDKRLGSKALENLYQRVGVYCRLKGLSSTEEVQQYMTHRINACGGSPEIFTKEAYAALWSYSHQGIPRLINKIGKLCLKAGETNQVKKIGYEIVQAVAAMFEKQGFTEEKKITPDPKIKKTAPREEIKTAFSVIGHTQFCLDPEMTEIVQCLSPQLRSQLPVMEDKQLMDLAGKMAIQHLQHTRPKNSADDPVIVWHTIKGRIFSALKSIKEPRPYCLA